MSAVKKIKQASLTILGIEAEPWEDVWKRIKELSKAFGDAEVLTAFEEWATLRQGGIIARPVAEFLKTATGQLRGTLSLKQNPEIKEFIYELCHLTGDTITFDRDQQAQIAKLMKEFKKDEIKSALREYYDQVQGDDFLLKRAAQAFLEKADIFIDGQRRQKKIMDAAYAEIARIESTPVIVPDEEPLEDIRL